MQHTSTTPEEPERGVVDCRRRLTKVKRESSPEGERRDRRGEKGKGRERERERKEEVEEGGGHVLCIIHAAAFHVYFRV